MVKLARPCDGACLALQANKHMALESSPLDYNSRGLRSAMGLSITVGNGR